MEREEFREMMEKLHNELKAVNSVDEKGLELLRTLMSDIQQLLNQTGKVRSDQNRTIIEQLTESMHILQGSHPKLVLTIKQVIETLSNMGI